MHNITIVMSDNTSEITNVFFPAISLDSTREYHIGLLSLDTYNSILNIRKGINDTFKVCDNICNTFRLPQGAYEVEEIHEMMSTLLQHAYDSKKFSKGSPQPVLDLIASPVTKRVTLKCNYTLDFTDTNNFAELLGLEKEIYEKDKTHIGTSHVTITHVNTISVECSLANGSYKNGVPSHDIYQFAPAVAPGYAINERPQNIIYYPLNTHNIDSVTIRLVDDNGDLIDFNEESITVRLHIKEWE